MIMEFGLWDKTGMCAECFEYTEYHGYTDLGVCQKCCYRLADEQEKEWKAKTPNWREFTFKVKTKI